MYIKTKTYVTILEKEICVTIISAGAIFIHFLYFFQK